MKKIKKQKKKEKIREIDLWQDFVFPKKDLLLAFSIVFSVLIIYLSFPCKMFYFDGLMFASIVEAKEPNWQRQLAWANHIAFNYCGHAYWKFLNYIGLEKDGYSALQIMNSLFSSLTVGLLFLFIKKVTEKGYIALIFSLLLAFSYSFWWRACDAYTVPPKNFWLLVSIMLVWSYTRQRSKLKLIIFSITTGIAILFHQSNIFFIPMVICGIIFAGKKFFKNILMFLLVLSIVVGVPYILVLTYQEKTLIDARTGEFTVNENTIKASYNWMLGNAGTYNPEPGGKYTNPFASPLKLEELSFSKSVKKNMVDSNLKNLYLDFDAMIRAMWYSEGYGQPGKQFWNNISKIIFIVMGIFLFIKVKLWKDQKYKALVLLTLVWWLTYMVFCSWFVPGESAMWCHHWLLWLVLIAGSLCKFVEDKSVSLLLRKTTLGLFLCSVVIIPPINFFDAIYPISLAENNDNYLRALWIKKHVKKGGVIVIAGMGWSNIQKVYIPSFANIGRISFDLIFIHYPKAQGLQVLKNQIEAMSNQGMNIYAFDEIFSKGIEEGLKQWKITMDEIKEIFKPYEFKTLGVYKDGAKLMQVFPKKGSAIYQRKEGIKYYNEKNYALSMESFLKIPQDSKTSFDYKLIGNCYILSNDRVNAASNWKKGYALDPSDEQLRDIIQHYGR
ncbi:MAG: hypothetical protein V1833_07600 [Elusimicrobiota bacterium]